MSILSAAKIYPDVEFHFMSHPSNRKILQNLTQNRKNIRIFESMPHRNFLHKMINSRLFLSDSGGAQEEAAVLGTPTLLIRNFTERFDGIGDNVELIGTETSKIYEKILLKLSTSDKTHPSFFPSPVNSPSRKIYKILIDEFAGAKNESTRNRSAS